MAEDKAGQRPKKVLRVGPPSLDTMLVHGLLDEFLMAMVTERCETDGDYTRVATGLLHHATSMMEHVAGPQLVIDVLASMIADYRAGQIGPEDQTRH